MSNSVYVTGTDTDAGKTYATVALMHAIRASGRSVAGMKPLASGCVDTPMGLRNADALALAAAGEAGLAYGHINPIALSAATAPEIAAAIDGVEVQLAPLLDAHAHLRSHADWVIVEGVGGWLAPLSGRLMQCDLVRALRLPVLLVVGLRLGCINHSLLTLRALREDGVRVLGWIGSAVDPNMQFVDETIAILRSRLDLPCLGVLTHSSSSPVERDQLDLTALYESPACRVTTAGAG